MVDLTLSTTIACAYAQEAEIRASRRARVSPEALEQRMYKSLLFYGCWLTCSQLVPRVHFRLENG